ncbi:MAG: glutathione S-transferase N-terminal domain-containing protein [Candidatus Aenigmarchaeota archaeon]|nr:glutathione S-transferase N-terminal domain-containing protein [Candidatus Aenigmarchaeota archaeon]
MLELYQFEECPYCARVRKKMSELCIDFVARNVPRKKEDRKMLMKVSGQNGVPTLVDSDIGAVIADDDDKIIAHLEKHYGGKNG